MTTYTRLSIFLSCLCITTVAGAQTTRQLDSHNHGEAMLDIAVDGDQIALTFTSPAANLVGFEHQPENDEQRAQIAKTKELLGDIRNLVVFSDGVLCNPVEQAVHWSFDEGEEHAGHEEHEEHDDHKEDAGHKEHDEHEEHAEHKEHEDHDDHKEDAGHKEHDEHEEHAEHEKHEDHDDHKEDAGHKEHDEHEEHAEHEKHEDHEEHENVHSEFESDFILACESTDRLEAIDVQLFDRFPAIETIRVQALFPKTQTSVDLTSDKRTINVSG